MNRKELEFLKEEIRSSLSNWNCYQTEAGNRMREEIKAKNAEKTFNELAQGMLKSTNEGGPIHHLLNGVAGGHIPVKDARHILRLWAQGGEILIQDAGIVIENENAEDDENDDEAEDYD